MGIRLILLGVFLSLAGCNSNDKMVNVRGILILDAARNDTSIDRFIPCEIHDTLPLGKVVQQMTQHAAYSVNPNQFQFAIMRTSWVSAADSFYVRRNKFHPQYISAVEMTMEKSYDAEGSDIPTEQIAGSITINKILPGRYRIVSIKKIILPE